MKKIQRVKVIRTHVVFERVIAQKIQELIDRDAI